MILIASRILNPESKLALSRSWNQSTLGGLLEIDDASDDALYAAMDWLFERQDAVETKLAKRHVNNGGRVLYDLSSSDFKGCQYPLAARGYSRDQKEASCRSTMGCRRIRVAARLPFQRSPAIPWILEPCLIR